MGLIAITSLGALLFYENYELIKIISWHQVKIILLNSWTFVPIVAILLGIVVVLIESFRHNIPIVDAFFIIMILLAAFIVSFINDISRYARKLKEENNDSQ